MVAGTGTKKVDWELMGRVANNLDSGGSYGIASLWTEAIEIANSLTVEHDAWSIAGGAIIGGTYDATVQHMVDNLGEGQRMHAKIVEALRANAKLWEASEGQNIDNFKPVFKPASGI